MCVCEQMVRLRDQIFKIRHLFLWLDHDLVGVQHLGHEYHEQEQELAVVCVVCNRQPCHTDPHQKEVAPVQPRQDLAVQVVVHAESRHVQALRRNDGRKPGIDEHAEQQS